MNMENSEKAVFCFCLQSILGELTYAYFVAHSHFKMLRYWMWYWFFMATVWLLCHCICVDQFYIEHVCL